MAARARAISAVVFAVVVVAVVVTETRRQSAILSPKPSRTNTLAQRSLQEAIVPDDDDNESTDKSDFESDSCDRLSTDCELVMTIKDVDVDDDEIAPAD